MREWLPKLLRLFPDDLANILGEGWELLHWLVLPNFLIIEVDPMDMVDAKSFELIFALLLVDLVDEFVGAKCALKYDCVGIGRITGAVREVGENAGELLEM